MRQPSPRFVVALGMIVSIAFAQAAVDGIERDLVVRMTRGGVQRLDADGSHGSGEVAEGVSISTPLASTLELHADASTLPATPRRPQRGTPACIWLPQSTPAAPHLELFPSDTRGRAPPSA